MGLFSAAVTEQINQIAAKSNEKAAQVTAVNTRSMNDDLNTMSRKVVEYFKDSPAILIKSKQELHDYIDKCIEQGYAGIDTETTGLDRIKDTIVGASLYTPGMPECYIPMKHLVPLFDTPYKDQLTYEEVGEEFKRLVTGNVKLIFANADFDLAMIYKDLKVDLIPAFYYDVISAWRCLREDEKDNSLKGLYAKYPARGKVDPQKFSDFFSPKLFPYCKPKVAALYAANDAKITYDLFIWQLPYVTKSHAKCQKHHLERIADLIWNVEFPMVAVCAHLHRRGMYLDDSIAQSLHERYTNALHRDEADLANCVQELIDTKDVALNRNRPFRTGSDFNPNSNPHVKYLLNNLLGSSAKTTGKEVLKEINVPATKAILNVRGDVKLLSTYVDKLPKSAAKDHRVHACFKALGAATGRMCIAEGQQVTTSNGLKNIEEIKIGDEVYCYNLDTQSIELAKIVNTWKTGTNKKCVKVDFGSDCIICTPEHKILVDGITWVEAQELTLGDVVYKITFSSRNIAKIEIAAVQSVSEVNRLYDVYDIEVENHHNFFVTGLLVHNSSDSPNLQNIPSKSHDIRHLFRATPEFTEKVEITDNKVTLLHCDSVPTTTGLTKVRDLTTDDILVMKDGKKETYCKILNINSDLGQSTIEFEIMEG